MWSQMHFLGVNAVWKAPLRLKNDFWGLNEISKAFPSSECGLNSPDKRKSTSDD